MELPIAIRTFPRLFPDTFGPESPFHPLEGVHLMMPDMLMLQLMYAARQIMWEMCMETGHPSLAEALPFKMLGIPGLYQELALLVSMVSNVMLHALVFSVGPSSSSSSSSERIWRRFKECMQVYAPWCRFQTASEWKAEAARLQGVLEELSLLYLDYQEAKWRFKALSLVEAEPAQEAEGVALLD